MIEIEKCALCGEEVKINTYFYPIVIRCFNCEKQLIFFYENNLDDLINSWNKHNRKLRKILSIQAG